MVKIIGENIYTTYYLCMVIAVLITVINIIKDQLDRRKRKSKQIFKLDRCFSDFILPLSWSVTLIIWLSALIIRAKDVYHLLYGGYISSVFQLLDTKFLESSDHYFYEQFYLSDYLTISRYQNKLITMQFWIIISLCNVIFHFYKGWQVNIIYENGINVNGMNLKWEKVVDYKWSNVCKKKLFKKGKYYNLVLKMKKSKFLDFHNETHLKINYFDRELVDNVLKEYINNKL